MTDDASTGAGGRRRRDATSAEAEEAERIAATYRERFGQEAYERFDQDFIDLAFAARIDTRVGELARLILRCERDAER